MSIVEANNGMFWIATNVGGAYRYDGQNFKQLLMNIGRKQEDGLFHNTIQSLLNDSEGNIWFPSMTHGGVSRFDGDNFIQFMPEDGLVYNMVRTVTQDRACNIFLEPCIMVSVDMMANILLISMKQMVSAIMI